MSRPLKNALHSLSAVIRKRARLTSRPPGTTKVRRKYRVPIGADFCASPSGNQIQLVPARKFVFVSPSSPIHSAFHSSGLRNPIVQNAGSLQAEARPPLSITRTFQKHCSSDSIGFPL